LVATVDEVGTGVDSAAGVNLARRADAEAADAADTTDDDGEMTVEVVERALEASLLSDLGSDLLFALSSAEARVGSVLLLLIVLEVEEGLPACWTTEPPSLRLIDDEGMTDDGPSSLPTLLAAEAVRDEEALVAANDAADELDGP
jgi:hypothetical protein